MFRFDLVRFGLEDLCELECGSLRFGSVRFDTKGQILTVPMRFGSVLPQFQRGSVRFGVASSHVWIVKLGVSVNVACRLV